MVELKWHLLSFYTKVAWMNIKLSTPVQNLWNVISSEQNFRVFEDYLWKLDNGFLLQEKEFRYDNGLPFFSRVLLAMGI